MTKMWIFDFVILFLTWALYSANKNPVLTKNGIAYQREKEKKKVYLQKKTRSLASTSALGQSSSISFTVHTSTMLRTPFLSVCADKKSSLGSNFLGTSLLSRVCTSDGRKYHAAVNHFWPCGSTHISVTRAMYGVDVSGDCKIKRE